MTWFDYFVQCNMFSQFFPFFVIITIFQLHQICTCSDASITLNLNFDTELSFVQDEATHFDDESSFGFPHSQDDLDKWFEKEKQLIEVVEKRLELIEEEIGLITEYLEDYDESTGEAMRHLREPRETPEERGKVVGSSAVLGHRMTSRYAGIVSHIRRFYTSEDFLENEENFASILEESEQLLNEGAPNATRKLAPGSEDLFPFMTSILGIQHSEGYRPPQLIYGFDPNTTTTSTSHHGASLNAIQCADLGMFALFRREYYIAVEWLEAASQLLTSWEDDEQDNLQLNIVSPLIHLAIQEHNRALHSDFYQTDTMKFYTAPIEQFGKRILAERKEITEL